MRLVDSRTPVDVIYTDFRKAFDKVNFEIILIQLQSVGIGGNLLQWFHSYLINRQWTMWL